MRKLFISKVLVSKTAPKNSSANKIRRKDVCETDLSNYYKILFREIERFHKKCENYFTKDFNFSK